MTETAIVLFVKQTGHVLATVTRIGDPASAPKVEELAGEFFPVRDDSGDVLVEIEPDELDSKAVPFEEDLVRNPQKCSFKDGEAHLIPGAAAVPTVTVAPTGVTIDLGANATEKTKVWAQVDSGTGQTRQHAALKGEIPVGSQTFELAKTLTAGVEYDVLALAEGREPVAKIDATV